MFSNDSIYANPFAGLETQFLQLKYFKEALGYIVSDMT